MTKQSIPERAPVCDLWSGLVLQIGTVQLISAVPQPDATVIASGDFVVRYGLRFLGKLHQSIVPGLVVLDYGDTMSGEEAWEFLLKHSNLHPRAEVVGFRNDGSDDMVFIKTLDMAVDPEVLIYRDGSAVKPLARPVALIAPEDETIPTRLADYLPVYPTLDAWQAENQS